MSQVQKKDERLTMSAGPNSISDRIRAAYGQQLLYHYDPLFLELFDDTSQKLQKVYQSSGDVIIMQGEAVLGLEAASACAVHPGDKTLNLVTGVYGAGYARHLKRFSGLDPLEIRVPYNQSIDPTDVEKILKKESDIRALAVVHCETPSGTVNPIKEICAIAQKYDVLTIVDAVSSFAGMPLPIDDWGMDICIAGAHKCLGAAPGSALMAVSQRAWQAMQTHPQPVRKSYLSLLDWKELWMEQRRFPYTVFVSQIMGVNEALTAALEEGLENRFARHSHAAQMCRAGAQAMGLELWPASEEIAASCITALKVPDNIDAALVIQNMRDEHNILITGSLKELSGKVLRIGHMGHVARPGYVEAALSALEQSLLVQGFQLEIGAGLEAAAALN